jgi:SAM-dependent methyltransferase
MSNVSPDRIVTTEKDVHEKNMQGSCRFCGAPLNHIMVDLGMSPLCNSMIKPEQFNAMERFYPLLTYVCDQCFLVQLQEYVSPDEIFNDYTYFSSYSDSWLEHARRYADMAIARFNLRGDSQVVELASNDGYLLRNFVAKGIRALGVEPAANVAEVAKENGIPTVVKFFGENTARELLQEGHAADLIIGNNVLAHVPDINDFVEGMKVLLKPNGVITMEFPHLMRLMDENQFDTIYHEHFSYLSLIAVNAIFAAHGLTIFDVDELPTHGGSLRIYARHQENTTLPVSQAVLDLDERERKYGFTDINTYLQFGERVRQTKRKLLRFLITARESGKTVVGYGAPGKGNTLLNYCGIRTDLLDYTVDRSPHKQGKFLPGTHIPVHSPERIRETKPDYILILPWNLKDEVVKQHGYVREWGGQFVVPIPEVMLIP